MSDSGRHRQQPTRLPCPWDSPGKNTGVGCHFLLQCMKVKSEREVAESCLTLRLLHPWDFPGKSTGVGCHCLLRIISSVPDKVKAVYVFSSCIAKQIFTIVCWQCLSKFKEVNPLYSLCYIKNTNSITCHWRGLFYIILQMKKIILNIISGEMELWWNF